MVQLNLKAETKVDKIEGMKRYLLLVFVRREIEEGKTWPLRKREEGAFMSLPLLLLWVRTEGVTANVTEQLATTFVKL